MKYSLTDKIRTQTIKEIIDEDKKNIFKLIKEGYVFNNDVLIYAHISKNIKNEKFTNVIVEHEKNDKVYEKDKDSVNKILKYILTLENIKEYKDEIIEEEIYDEE